MSRITGRLDLESDRPEARDNIRQQAGGGLLGVVAVLGIAMVLVQGAMYYRSKSSATFVGSEKDKILAQQMAEAGIETNIADLGSRKIKIHAGLDTMTYSHKTLGNGEYSSQLTMVALGDSADTVDLKSTGQNGKGSQTVQTRLRLKKHIDSQMNVTSATTVKMTIMSPSAMPPITTTPAFTACVTGASPNCTVCHVPGGDSTKATALTQAKGIIGPVHSGHLGDYVTTAALGCNLYLPTPTTVTTYDTTYVADTIVKVKTLSWR